MKNTIIVRLSRLTGVGRETILAEYLDFLQSHRDAGDANPEAGAHQDLIALYVHKGYNLGTLGSLVPLDEEAMKAANPEAEDDPAKIADMRTTPLSKLPAQLSLASVVSRCTPVRQAATASVLAFDKRLARHYLRDLGFSAEVLDTLEKVSARDLMTEDYLASVLAPFARLLSEEGQVAFAEYIADRDFRNVASTSNFALVSVAQTLANFFHQHYLLNTRLFSGKALRSVLGSVLDGNALVRRVAAMSAHLPFYMLPFTDVTVTPYTGEGGAITVMDMAIRLRMNVRATSVYSLASNSAAQNRLWLEGQEPAFESNLSFIAGPMPVHNSTRHWVERSREVRDTDLGEACTIFVDYSHASFALPGDTPPSFSLEVVKESNRVCYNGIATLHLPAFTAGGTGDRIITNLHTLKSHALTAFGCGLKGLFR